MHVKATGLVVGCLLEQVACQMTAALSRCSASKEGPRAESTPLALLFQNSALVG